MTFCFGTRTFGLLLGCWAASAGFVWAQSSGGEAPTRPDREQLPQPVYKVAHKNAETSEVGLGPEQSEHPLAAIRMAQASVDNIKANVKDYTATLVKRERIDGKLNDPESMFVKVRHEPFSVYMYFVAPDRLKGQEVIYVAGQNGGNMLAHGVGVRKLIGTVSLAPNSALAMSGQRYPITEIGIENLTKRLVEVAEKDSQYGECEVKFFKGAKINPGQRVCTCIQVTHPVPRKNFLFNQARVFVDDQLNIPLRYEAYEWPAQPGGPMQLLEEYTYLNVKLNVGLTDADFDPKNPAYSFQHPVRGIWLTPTAGAANERCDSVSADNGG